ncbi:cation-transporting P-type ATPase [uncultured Clostridium sp.]|uniref:P-type ATPase n=1 Tax=uncultured Clostridium sp. TaxID=59620 RepID=UPI00258C3352|nr:cation-transporting P-type ATPase [uncultured Clostridium sp.]
MVKPYNKSYKEVLKSLDTSLEKGLTEEECIYRKQKWGDNKIYFYKENLFKNIFSLKNIYLLLNLIICIFMFLFKEYFKLGIISFILFINIYIKFFILMKNKENIEYIDKINTASVEVLRDGKEKIIKSSNLVVGDIIYFRKNSLIAADIRILKSKDLKVDESNITGEKFIKEKYNYKLDYVPSNIGEINNMLFKGSIVKEGNGIGVVIQTGNNSILGSMFRNLKNINKRNFLSKIEKNINKTYCILTIINILIFIISNYNYKNLLNGFYLIYSISFIGIIIFYINYIKRYYIKNDIDIRNISIIENIRNINVMFLEKVGSMSKGEIYLKKIFTDFKFKNSKEIEYSNDINLKRVLDIITLVNCGIYDSENNYNKGSLIEIAYLKFLAEKESLRDLIKNRNREIFKIEIEWDKKFLTTLNKNKKGYRAYSRGKLEDILKRCTYIMIDGVEKKLTEEYIEIIKTNNYNLLTEGLITEGLAYRSFDYKPSLGENIESNLTFVGIAALENKLYNDAKERIEKIKNKNITPILFTEEHKISAMYLGFKIGLIKSKDEVISGVEIENLKDEELIKLLSKVKIYSNLNINLKNRIIDIFKSEGYKTLVIGESIGDISFLTKSDVGICKDLKFNIVGKVSDAIITKDYLTKIFKLYNESDYIYNGIKELGGIILLQFITLSLFMVILNIGANISFDLIKLNVIIVILYITYLLFLIKRENLKFIFKNKIRFIIINIILFLGVSFI